MAKLKNLGGAVDLFRPAGEAESCHVDAGQVVEVPGTVNEQSDAYVINGRAWPKKRWELQTDAPTPAPAKAEKPAEDGSAADSEAKEAK